MVRAVLLFLLVGLACSTPARAASAAEQAFEAAAQAVQASPGDFRAHLALASAAEALSRRDLAADEYVRAMELAGNDPEPFLRTGDWLLRLGDPEGARTCYHAAEELAPGTPGPLRALGNSYVVEYLFTQNQSKLVLALSPLERAAAMEGASTGDLYAYVDAALMRFAHAPSPTLQAGIVRVLGRGLDREPDSAVLLYARGRLHTLTGARRAARDDLQRALELGLSGPDADVARGCLALVEESR